jgi:(E)-4-hydroxy-3-methylbut-2-enyl-diphosphate synthase
MASELSVSVGGVRIGGGAPVAVQSMTNTPTSDAAATLAQVRRLARLGCDLVRVAVPDREAAGALPALLADSPVPLVADIHFSADLAMAALDAGVAKLRLNPGNIRRRADVERVAGRAAELSVPIRVGVNSGSVPGDLRKRYGGVNADSMWAAAERHVLMLENTGFRDIVLSLKATDPQLTVEVNERASRERGYPLHLGVTEAGTPLSGSVRTAVAFTRLLDRGIGDTVRVSLAGSPEPEPVVAWEILSSLGLRRGFVRVIGCPTCARARLDVGSLASRVEESLLGTRGGLTVAVMGCEVNGPGEAREADVAVIATPAGFLLFSGGTMREKLREDELLPALRREVSRLLSADDNNQGGTA